MNQTNMPLDPMFTRPSRQPAEAYARRPSSYVSSRSSTAHAQPTALHVAPQQTLEAKGITPPTPPKIVSNKKSRVKNLPAASGKLNRFGSLHRQTMVLYGMAGIVFVVGLAASWNGFHANRQVAAQVKHLQNNATPNTSGAGSPPSTQKPTVSQVNSYAVASNLPRYIDIPKLKVHARTLSEGVDKNGELQTPWNIYDTGWYNASSQPGQNGAMLIDGHSGIGKTVGVFHNLSGLAQGDIITITRGDGTIFNYAVASVTTVNVADVNMSSMLVSPDTAKPGLNLITCAGDQIPGTTELNKRVLVRAVLQ